MKDQDFDSESAKEKRKQIENKYIEENLKIVDADIIVIKSHKGEETIEANKNEEPIKEKDTEIFDISGSENKIQESGSPSKRSSKSPKKSAKKQKEEIEDKESASSENSQIGKKESNEKAINDTNSNPEATKKSEDAAAIEA